MSIRSVWLVKGVALCLGEYDTWCGHWNSVHVNADVKMIGFALTHIIDLNHYQERSWLKISWETYVRETNKTEEQIFEQGKLSLEKTGWSLTPEKSFNRALSRDGWNFKLGKLFNNWPGDQDISGWNANSSIEVLQFRQNYFSKMQNPALFSEFF